MRSMGQNPEWSIVTELKKQYDVSSVSPDSPIAADLDVLLVAQPSSLTQKQIDNLTEYVKKGGPTLLFLDPLPVDNPAISPEVPKQPPGGPFGGGPPPEPKGNLRPLLDLVGLDWPSTEIVWNPYNPHPQLAMLDPEIVFIGKGSGQEGSFNSDQIATSGLQEVVMLFPGLLRPRPAGRARSSSRSYAPTTRAGLLPGAMPCSRASWACRESTHAAAISPPDISYTLAARITGAAPLEKTVDKDADAAKKDEAKKDDKPATIKVIAIADLDMICEQFFELRRQKIENLDFDNVTFVLNCVDVLAGDDRSSPSGRSGSSTAP